MYVLSRASHNRFFYYSQICVDPRPPAESPPLSMLSLSLKTYLNDSNATREILVASAIFHPAVNIDGPTVNWERQVTSFTAVRRLGNAPFPFGFTGTGSNGANRSTIEPCTNERNLLLMLMGMCCRSLSLS